MLDQPLHAMRAIDAYQYDEYIMYRTHTLYSIPKIHIPLKNLLPAIRLPILPPEVNCINHNNNSNQHITRQHPINPRVISRPVLRAENQRPSNTANTTEPNHRR